MSGNEQRWGVWSVRGKEMHVAPIDADGFVAGGHTLDACCECNPRIEPTDDGVKLYVHGEEHEPPAKIPS
jgi:hypothetical protein